MPKIDINAAPNVSSLVSTQRADGSYFGPGAVSQQAGKAITDIGETLKVKAENDEITQVRQLMVEASFQWDKDVTKRAEEAPEGAKGLTAGVSTDVKAWVDENRGKFTSKAAIEEFNLKAAHLMGSSIKVASAYESKEHARFSVANVQKTVSTINNRTVNDLEYYESGRAALDIKDQAKVLRDKKVPEDIVAAREDLWNKQLDLSAMQGELRQAKDPISAQALVDDMEAEDSPWRKKLSTEDYAKSIESAWRNVELVTVKAEKDEKEAESAIRADNSEMMLGHIMKANDGDPESILKLEKVRRDFYENPSAYDLAAMSKVDNLLDKIAEDELNGSSDGAKRIANEFALKRKWEVAELNLKVEETSDIGSLIGLRAGLNALQRKADPKDQSGITPGEFSKLNVKILRKIDALSRRGEKRTEKELKEAGKAFDKMVKNAETKNFFDIRWDAKNANTLEDVAVVEASLDGNPNLTPGHRYTVRSQLMAQQKSIIKGIEKDDKEQRKIDEKATERQWGKEEARIDITSQRPDLTEADAEELRQQLQEGFDNFVEYGVGIDQATYVKISARLDKTVIASKEKTGRIALVQGIIIGSDQVLSPSNTEHVTAVNVWFDAVNSALVRKDSAEPGYRDRAIVEAVSKLKIVPTAVRNEIIGNLNSENPENVIRATTLLKKLESTNTQIADQIGNPESVSFGRQVLLYANYGRKPEDAVAKAIELRSIDNSTREARVEAVGGAKGIYATQKLDDFLSDSISDGVFSDGASGWSFAGGLSRTPSVDEIPAELRRSFKQVVTDEYAISGDIKAASESALATLRGMWGTHYQRGSAKLMKFPPQKMYPFGSRGPEETSRAIMEQLGDNIQRRGLIEGEITEDRLVIEYNPNKTKNGKPVYHVILLPISNNAEFSAPVTIADDWTPDYDTSRAKQRDQDAISAAKNAARKGVIRENEDFYAPPEKFTPPQSMEFPK